MPGFESIIDQERPKRILTTYLRDGNVPHALLFSGIKGIGKRTTAHLFSKACNCERLSADHGGQAYEDVPCGACKSCRKIESGHHPDIIRIQPSGNIIKIAQIRDLCHTLSMRPYEAAMRVVLIVDAHQMNPEASNALLKVLEEPPDRTVIILTALNSANVLPTIASRCLEVRFSPISRDDLTDLLCKRSELSIDTARVVASMAHGSLSTAMALSDPAWIAYRRWLVQELGLLTSRPFRGIMAFAERLASNKDRLPEILDVILSWVRDLWMVQMDPGNIINVDVVSGLQSMADRMSGASLLSMIDSVQDAQQRLRNHTNARLSLESLLLRMAKI